MTRVLASFQKGSGTVTTDSSGDGSASIGPFQGYLEKIIYTKTDFADTVDFTITDSDGQGLWTESNVTADKIVKPALLVQDDVGANRTSSRRPFIDGSVSVVVAQGGDTKTGTFTVVCVGV